MKLKALYTLAEVARLLGRPLRTVQRWAKRGRLATVQMAGSVFVPLAALQTQGLIWDSIKLSARLSQRLAGGASSGNAAVTA